MLEETISNFIEQQFPSIYREEGPYFIEFMKQYYVWLETHPTSPIYQARRHVSNHDIDSTVDNFLIYFKEKYLKGIQINTATNTKQLIKNSIDLYRSKGTENAIHLFFDLIFSAESEVYYPGEDVFRLSSAEWVLPRYVEVTSSPANRLMVGRPIIGVNSGATAFVEKLVRRKIRSNYVEILYISAITGEFETGEVVKLKNAGSTLFGDFPTVLGSLTTVEVDDGGAGFAKGEVIKLVSRTGDQARGLVSGLQSITGIVDFTLVDGGWGYTVNTDIEVSQKVLNLSNVHIISTTNTTLEDKIVTVVQEMANVQWYDNTASFGVGNTIYNYTSGATPTLIGMHRIISAEYGTSNTTNYFLLNTISGNNYMDPAAAVYYSAGNTANFKVQNAGWANNTAQGTFTDNSSNAVIYCTGNSLAFTPDDYAIQRANNVTYAEAKVRAVNTITSTTFSLNVTGLDGLYLTNQSLFSNASGQNVAITSVSYDIGLHDITGTFRSLPGNYIRDLGANSDWDATIDQISFGSGANTGMASDLLHTETIALNTNYLRDHLAPVQQNNLNAASYGASLNTANLTNMTLANALQYQNKTLGTIARLQNENPGIGYSYAPFVSVIDPLVAPLSKLDFVIRYTSTSGVFSVGEEITQAINGAKGLVKFANTTEVHIRRLKFADRWTVGSSPNTYLMVGSSSGHYAYPTEVTYDVAGTAGHNAVITTKVTSSNSAAATIKITDSGFCFRDGDVVEFSDVNDVHSGTATASVTTAGRASGFYKTTSGFVSTNKYLYDGDYYQDFSYDIRSPITVGRYSDMLKSVLHVSGTKVFSSIMKNNFIDSSANIVTSSVVVANT